MKKTKLIEEKINAYIWLEKMADKKITYMTQLSKDEIGALCLAEKKKAIKDGVVDIEYTIKDVFIIEQEVNGATCELSPQGIAKLYGKLGKDKDNLLCWYHSHVNMGTSPSSQDDTMFNDLCSNNDSFFIRLIGNKKGEFSSCVVDKEEGYRFEDLSIYYEEEKDEIKDFIQQEIDEKVKIKTIIINNKSDKKTDKKQNKSGNNYYNDIESSYNLFGFAPTEDDIKRYLLELDLSSYGEFGYWENKHFVKPSDIDYEVTKHCVGLVCSGTKKLTDKINVDGAVYDVGLEVDSFLREEGYL